MDKSELASGKGVKALCCKFILHKDIFFKLKNEKLFGSSCKEENERVYSSYAWRERKFFLQSEGLKYGAAGQ